LQISSDERARVVRIAKLFSEEDLARHLQIMLRTHAELGYRQEQRFHLELGLLKLAHAQRLLPLEQLLSGAEVTRSVAPDRKLTLAPEAQKTEAKRSDPATPPRAFISPFAADSARKGTPRSEHASESAASASRPAPAAISSTPVVMGSAAPAVAAQAAPETGPQAPASPVSQSAPAPDVRVQQPRTEDVDSEVVRKAVLSALGSTGQTMLCSMLEAGEWNLGGRDLVIRVAASAALIEMSVSNDAKRTIIAAASGTLGHAVRLQVIAGAAPSSGPVKTSPSNGGRGRAEQEPVVQRMKEKFGAEIRTIIDYKQTR
jgi:DNA polymerase-3 subunit gamma/tau